MRTARSHEAPLTDLVKRTTSIPTPSFLLSIKNAFNIHVLRNWVPRRYNWKVMATKERRQDVGAEAGPVGVWAPGPVDSLVDGPPHVLQESPVDSRINLAYGVFLVQGDRCHRQPTNPRPGLGFHSDDQAQVILSKPRYGHGKRLNAIAINSIHRGYW